MASTTSSRAALVRAWARSRGLEVSDRGRVPAAIVHAYEQAGG